MSDQTRPGVLLDVDGTLLDTNYLHALAWWQAMRDAGITGVTMADAHQGVGMADQQFVEHVAPTADDRATKKVIKGHQKRYAKLQSEVASFDRADALVERCDAVGLSVVLATSGQKSDLSWMLPAIGVDEGVLTGVITSADVEQAKPAPDLMTTAMENHGLDPARTVAIGDTVWDVQAARAAGVRLIAFTTGGIAECQLRSAGADEVWTGPADLLEHWSESIISRLDHA